MDDQGDIGARSNGCMQGFDELIPSLTTCPGELRKNIPLMGVENEFARFKVWCGNLGALQRGKSSLDVRLRGSTVMRETVLRFLSQLQVSLRQSKYSRIKCLTVAVLISVMDRCRGDHRSSHAV